MRLPQDRILHIDTEIKDGKVSITAEWQGELVRCKDCKHGEEDYPQRIRKQMDERWKDTPQTYSCKHSTYSHDGEFFCGYGERREP